MVTREIMNMRTFLFIVVAALVVVAAVLVNPYITQFSTAARSHNIQNHIKTSKGSSNRNHNLSSSSLQPFTSNDGKIVIINFDDSHESDYTYAKPILDKYGFKATFFEVCNWIEAGYHDEDTSITLQQISALQQDGMDIESHTMTHSNLNDLSSQADLDYEIGQSKQCLENHGFNPTIFAYPNGKGADIPKVVNTVAKYYDLARTDTKSALTFLHCDGNNDGQTDCRMHFSNGTLSPSN